MCRHKRLKGTLSDAAPILWQYGALARLKKGETIDKLLYGGYSTISLGYAGLYECVKYMTGKSHTDPGATPFALEVMQHMNDACDEWKKADEHRLLPLRHPAGIHHLQVCQVPADALRHHRGHHGQELHHQQLPRPRHRGHRRLCQAEIRGRSSRRLSTGGAISYVEVPNMQDNLEAVMQRACSSSTTTSCTPS